MTAPTIELLVGKFADWLRHRRELNEIRQMNRADIDMIASDLQVAPGDLDKLIAAGPHSADEMPEMLKALGISLENLVQAEPFMVRDMQRVCAQCRDKAHCHSDVAAGTAAEHYKEYCPNAETIESLSKPAAKH